MCERSIDETESVKDHLEGLLAVLKNSRRCVETTRFEQGESMGPDVERMTDDEESIIFYYYIDASYRMESLIELWLEELAQRGGA